MEPSTNVATKTIPTHSRTREFLRRKAWGEARPWKFASPLVPLAARFAASSIRFEARGARDVGPACRRKLLPLQFDGNSIVSLFRWVMRRFLGAGRGARHFPLG